jgi:hypothetical protein
MSDDERNEQFEDAVDSLAEDLQSQHILTEDDAPDTYEAPDDAVSDVHEENPETDNVAQPQTDENTDESEIIIDEAVLRQQEACMTEEEKQVHFKH